MKRVGIVGLGLIGGSLALSLRRARPQLHLLGVDVDAAALEQARAASAIDDAAAPDRATYEECDVVVLAMPARELIEAVVPVARRMRGGAALTDVCGAKEAVCARGATQRDVVFVGAHPMAGTEFRGFAAAKASLFQGATVAICPAVGAEQGRAEATSEVRELWLAAGAGKLLEVDARAHDHAVTYASHLPYLAAAMVVDSLSADPGAAPLARELAAGGFRDTTRLAGDGTVGGAASLNRHVAPAARELAERLRTLAHELETTPDRALEWLGRLADERRRMKLPKP